MSLPDSWIERIFSRMAVRYGTDWTMKWTGFDPNAIKADWAEVLGNTHPDSIAYALGFLPLERPPTATQFRDICRRAPDRTPPPKAIEGPKADPERVRAELRRVRELTARRKPLQWAYDLQEREKAGEALTLQQQHAWREALTKAPLEGFSGDFKPIAADLLPPGMRPMVSNYAEVDDAQFA